MSCIFLLYNAADNLGFTDYPKPYLSSKAKIPKNIKLGANFASAGSGYYEATAQIYVSAAFDIMHK